MILPKKEKHLAPVEDWALLCGPTKTNFNNKLFKSHLSFLIFFECVYAQLFVIFIVDVPN